MRWGRLAMIVALLVLGAVGSQGACYLFWHSEVGQNYLYLDLARKQAIKQAQQQKAKPPIEKPVSQP